MHLAHQRSPQTLERLMGADIQGRPQNKFLPQWDVEKWPGSFAHALILGIGSDTDHSGPAALHLKAAADRVLPFPVARHHGAVHDGDQRRAFIVSAAEFTPRENRDTQGL